MKKKLLKLIKMSTIFIIIIICFKISTGYFGGYKNKLYNYVLANSLYETKPVPVLMYHSVSNTDKGVFTVLKNDLDKQMKYIKDAGYNPITLDELYDSYTNKIKLPDTPIVITFDDGNEDNFKNAYPVLKKYNIKATMFIITDGVDKNSYYMNSEQLKELNDNNIDIESHTTKHQKLNRYSYEEQLEIMKNSKDFLKKLLNKEVNYIAYPFGKHNKDTEKAAKDAGYKMAFTTRFGQADYNQGMYKLRRICVPGNINIKLFKYLIKLP